MVIRYLISVLIYNRNSSAAAFHFNRVVEGNGHHGEGHWTGRSWSMEAHRQRKRSWASGNRVKWSIYLKKSAYVRIFRTTWYHVIVPQISLEVRVDIANVFVLQIGNVQVATSRPPLTSLLLANSSVERARTVKPLCWYYKLFHHALNDTTWN